MVGIPAARHHVCKYKCLLVQADEMARGITAQRDDPGKSILVVKHMEGMETAGAKAKLYKDYDWKNKCFDEDAAERMEMLKQTLKKQVT